MAKRFLSTINLPKLASDPVSGSEGDIYYNTTSDKIKYYNGSTWEEVGSGTAGADEVFYQNSAPSSPSLGDIWIDADSDAIATSLNIDLLLPSQTNNSGKYLTTNGTSASWGSISGFATTSALSSHESDTTNVHGITDTANIVLTNDARLSDSRTPTSHSASHGSAGSDPITIAQSQVTNLTTDLGAKAPLASPELTGVPTAPTAVTGTNTTQIATTAFIQTELSSLSSLPSTSPETVNYNVSNYGQTSTSLSGGFSSNVLYFYSNSGAGAISESLISLLDSFIGKTVTFNMTTESWTVQISSILGTGSQYRFYNATLVSGTPVVNGGNNYVGPPYYTSFSLTESKNGKILSVVSNQASWEYPLKRALVHISSGTIGFGPSLNTFNINNCFSSSYNNYLIKLYCQENLIRTNIRFIQSNSSAITTTTYGVKIGSISDNGNTLIGTASGSQSQIPLAFRGFADIDINAHTTYAFYGRIISDAEASGGNTVLSCFTNFNETSSVTKTGFQIFRETSSIYSNVVYSVYGYNNKNLQL